MIELVKFFLKLNLRTISNFFGFMDSVFFAKIEAAIERLLLPKISKWSSFSLRASAGLLYFCTAALMSTTFLLILTASGLALAFNPSVFMILYLTYFALSAGAFIWAIRSFNKFKAKIPTDGKVFWLEKYAQLSFDLISTPCRFAHNFVCEKLLSKVNDWGASTINALGTIFFWLEEFIIIETAFIILGAIFAPGFSVIAPLTFAGLILSFTPGFLTSISAFALISEGLGINSRSFSEQVKSRASEHKKEKLYEKMQVHGWHLKSSREEPEPEIVEEKNSGFFNPLYNLYSQYCHKSGAKEYEQQDNNYPRMRKKIGSNII